MWQVSHCSNHPLVLAGHAQTKELLGRLPPFWGREVHHKTKKKSIVTMNTTTSQKLMLTLGEENVELKNKCVDILRGLQTHEHGWAFATPVDPVELELDDYFEIIKKPMDLGTIQETLDAGFYHSFEDFTSDVRLTFENAMRYNKERTIVHEMAKELKTKFEVDLQKLIRLLLLRFKHLQSYNEHAENSKQFQAEVIVVNQRSSIARAINDFDVVMCKCLWDGNKFNSDDEEMEE